MIFNFENFFNKYKFTSFNIGEWDCYQCLIKYLDEVFPNNKFHRYTYSTWLEVKELFSKYSIEKELRKVFEIEIIDQENLKDGDIVELETNHLFSFNCIHVYYQGFLHAPILGGLGIKGCDIPKYKLKCLRIIKEKGGNI